MGSSELAETPSNPLAEREPVYSANLGLEVYGTQDNIHKPRDDFRLSAANPSADEKVVVTRNKNLLFFVFLLCGTTGMIGWNSLLNMLPTILTDIYHLNTAKAPFSDTMTATYFSCTCVTTLILTKLTAANTGLARLGLVLMVILSLGPPVICASDFPYRVISPAMHVYGAILGISVGLCCSCSIALAAKIPGVVVGGVASGMGLAGLWTFTCWMILRRAIFRQQARIAVWCQGSISCLLALSAFATLQYLITSNILSEASIQPQQSALFDRVATPAGSISVAESPASGGPAPLKAHENNQSFPAKDEENSIKYVLRVAWFNLLLRFFIFYETLIVFPNIAPIGWEAKSSVTDICTGAFQVADFFGRYLPNPIKALMLRERTVAIFVAARVPLLIFMCLVMAFRHESFWSNAVLRVLLMILLAISNGMLSTSLTLYLPKHFDSPKMKARSSAASMAVGFLGIVAGQWSSKLLKLSIA